MLRTCALTTVLLAFAGTLNAGDSASLMDISTDGKTMLVANTDTGTVSIVDIPARKLLKEIPVGDHPEGASFVPNTNLSLVTVYGDDVVKFVDLVKQEVVFTLPVGDEPYGVVTTKDGRYAYVTLDYPGAIVEIDVAAKKVTRTSTVGVGCRGLALSADEKTLYVTEFFSGTLLAVSRESGKVTDSWPGQEQDNLARHVVLHPKRGKAYLSHIRSRVTSFDARGSIFPQVTFCDLDKPATTKDRRRSIAMDTFNGVYVVTNPWEAALSPDGSKIYTIYAGTDDMNVSRTIDDDYEEIDRLGRAVTVGKHPRAVRTSPDGKEVYVYNTLEYSVAILSETLTKKLGKIDVATPAHTAEWRRGKELFQSALAPMGTARWIACSSCHPDGLTDGRVWQNPEGHRKTMSLFALAHTHPLHWSGDRDEVQDFEYTIRGKLMQGRGLAKGHTLKPRAEFTEFAENDQKTSGLSSDLDALAIYTNAFKVRLSPHAPGGKLTESAIRGKAIFENKTTNCTQCHSGPYFSDSSLKKPFTLHDVGTGGASTEKIGSKYDTPTLLGIYRQLNFLHDGRAKTIEEVLTLHNKEDKHGKTSHLRKEEIDDLTQFLRSLPYETPPDETPNTVPYRLK